LRYIKAKPKTTITIEAIKKYNIKFLIFPIKIPEIMIANEINNSKINIV
jgi:hypothetical protein